MRFIASKMDNWNRNRFRLQTQGAETANPGSIVTVNLPENALLHMPSFRMYCDFLGVGSGTGNDAMFAKMGNAGSLISKLEVYCNGIQLQHGCSEYNTVFRALKISRSGLERDTSVDACLDNSLINNGQYNDNMTICTHSWPGVLNEASAEYIPTELLGSIQVRITFASPSVLCGLQTAVPATPPYLPDPNVASPLVSAQQLINTQAISYKITNIYFTIDSAVPDMCYNMLLREQLASAGELAINYKNYYTFQLDSIISVGSTNRLSLSSGSIDKMFTLFRDASYTNVGIPATALIQNFGEAYSSNFLAFRSYDSIAYGTALPTSNVAGTFGHYYQINNVQYPQYVKTSLECLADVYYCENKLSDRSGNLVGSQATFNQGMFQAGLLLNCPTELGVGLKSGYDSRGINTQMTSVVSGQVIPAAGTGLALKGPNTGVIQSFVVVEVTQSIIVGIGKQIAVSF